jgi:hypothetical protein
MSTEGTPTRTESKPCGNIDCDNHVSLTNTSGLCAGCKKKTKEAKDL